MEHQSSADIIKGQRYETVFCIFIAALVFLFRDNAQLVYPQVLYLLLALLGFNLASGLALKKWPIFSWIPVSVVLGNCGIITAILVFSGGPESNLWVLYLLPIYTVCLFLQGKHLVLIVGGIISFNLLFHGIFAADGFGSALDMFNLGLKAGLFVFASAITWKISQKDRRLKEKMALQRIVIDQMESHLDVSSKMADVGSLSSGIAHDLGNPLAVIIGTVKMLLEDDERAAPFKADLQRIERSAELCRTITANVLNLAKNNSLATSPCSVNDLLEEALSIFEPTLAQHRIAVEKRLTGNLPPIEASASHLQRVFLNLMSNAKGVLKNGGVLRIRTQMADSTEAGRSWVQVIVEDNGPGFPPHVLANIFKPFNTTKAPGEGTGLGLYLSQDIVHKHKGRLMVQNRPEGGARFVFSFPVPQVPLPRYETPNHIKAA